MRWATSLPRGLAVVTAGLFSVSLVAALVGAPFDKATEAPQETGGLRPPLAKNEVVPLFAKTEPAANPTELVLMPDETGLRGWVAGAKNHAGGRINIKAGNREFEVAIADDNTFVWPQTSAKPLPLTVTLIAIDGNKGQPARTTLPARAEGVRHAAFVVTDRSAYRPGHTLKFVAYLRDTTDGIDFKPVPNRDYVVDVTSEARGTRAARVKARTDADGRLTGQYTFSDADSLDHYRLTITPEGEAQPLDGTARVLLGEYRKTKVGLKLKGEVKDGKLVVTFDARDYLDRPVRGTSATWSAVVTKAADAGKLALDPTKFAVQEGGPPSADDFNALPADERLLVLANGVSAMAFSGFGGRAVATREGTAEFAGDKAGTVTLDLWPEWTKGEHTVSLTAVFLDETGRENRAEATFSLSPKAEKSVRVSTPKDLYATGEKVPVAITPAGLTDKDAPATTLIVVKLEANPASPWFAPQVAIDEDGGLIDNARIPPLGAKPKKPVAEGWKAQPVYDPVGRKMLTAVPVVNGKADVDLKQPGAYKLVALTRLADGSTIQSETGVVVRAPAKLPGLVLRLDARELPAGGRLTGTVHSRFAGAKLLLTLRDAAGVKLVKPLTAGANGLVAFDEALPANLRYGCAVTVQYVEAAGVVHADLRDVYVIPTDRTLTVTTSTPDTVGPGADVKLNFQVNRAEEVDLVVSVFDESLLSVTGDLSENIRDYFLADGRGQGRAARDLTATRLGGVEISALVAKGKALLDDKDALAKEPGLETRLTELMTRWKAGELYMNDAVTLVRLAGFEVYLAQPIYGSGSGAWKVPKSARLADLLRRDAINEGQKQYLSATVIDNVVLLALGDRTGFDPWVMHRGNYYGNAFNGYNFCGGFACSGYQFGFGSYGFGAANLGGQFGRGFGGFGGGFGGGGFGGGIAGFGGAFSGAQGSHSFPGGNIGIQGQPFVGGQMGFSNGFNRDFGGAPAGAPLGAPGLGLADDVVRRDFADSAYWTTSLRTDTTGKATANFKLPDSLTNWRVQVVAVSPKMHVGSAQTRFKTSRPVMIWPMLPRAFAEGDLVSVFGTVHNLSDQEQNVRVHLKAENGQVMSVPEQTVKVPAKGSVPVFWTYRAGKPGMTDLLMSAKCDAGSDASLKKLPVVAAALTERVTASGIVGQGDLKVTLPEGFDPKSAQVSVTVAPSLAADLADTLPYLVEYPYGCVEQTMSRFLPALRVGLILKQSGLSTVKVLEQKLPKVVEAGQKRLIELQQPDGGWGWQGSGQTHEMMTPYALFGLLAAEEAGYPCPNPTTIPNGLGRLKQYLAQTGPSWDLALNLGWGVAPLPGGGPPGGPPAPAGQPFGQNGRRTTEINDTLFCLWVAGLDAERAKKSGVDVTPWFVRIEKTVGRAEMSDTGHALALELAAKHGKKELADKLAAELRKRAQKSGDRVFWTKAGFSRWGDNTIEVTATVLKALVAHDTKDPLIPGVLAYFHSTKRGDRWDSTKDTACVLYALCDYLAAVQAGPAAGGTVTVALNGTELGKTKLDTPESKVVRYAGKELKVGENVIRATGEKVSAGALVRVSVSFTRTNGGRVEARDHGIKVARTVSVRDTDGKWTELKSGATVPLGSYVKVRVTAAPGAGHLQYFLIESPKPAGFETVPASDRRFPAPPEQFAPVLREDREAMTCFHYEHAGSAAAEFVVLAEFAGEFALPPARGEQMYRPTESGHSDSFVLKVAPKK